MAEHPEAVIKETEETYGPEMAAAVAQKTLDWIVPNKYMQDVGRLEVLRDYTERAEAEVERWNTKPLETPTKESIAAEQKLVNACPYSRKTVGKITSKQAWSDYRFKKAKWVLARMEAAGLRKALDDHETMMEDKYGYDSGYDYRQNNPRYPATLCRDLERAEGERHGFPDL